MFRFNPNSLAVVEIRAELDPFRGIVGSVSSSAGHGCTGRVQKVWWGGEDVDGEDDLRWGRNYWMSSASLVKHCRSLLACQLSANLTWNVPTGPRRGCLVCVPQGRNNCWSIIQTGGEECSCLCSKCLKSCTFCDQLPARCGDRLLKSLWNGSMGLAHPTPCLTLPSAGKEELAYLAS